MNEPRVNLLSNPHHTTDSFSGFAAFLRDNTGGAGSPVRAGHYFFVAQQAYRCVRVETYIYVCPRQ